MRRQRPRSRKEQTPGANAAPTEGPERITRQEKETLVKPRVEEFENLAARAGQPLSLVQFFAESPLARAGIKLVRARENGRKLRL